MKKENEINLLFFGCGPELGNKILINYFGDNTVNIAGDIFKIKFYDTYGNMRLKIIPKSIYNNMNGIILVYDISSKTSYYNSIFWMKYIKE